MNQDQFKSMQHESAMYAHMRNERNPNINESFGLSQGQEAKIEPPITDAVHQAFQAMEELAGSIEWLLQKIQPVCQSPQTKESVVGIEGNQIQAAPSPLRAKLENLKGIAEGLSRRISSVRYTIEI